MLCLGSAAMPALGGSLDSPAAPDNAESAMFTLSDVYNVLTTGATTNKRAGGFAVPTGGPTNGTYTGCTFDQVYGAAKTDASMYITPKSGVVTSHRAGDDGELEKGRAWPNPRFTVQADTNCVLDNLTGLMWARNANQFGQVDWATALASCNDLVYGGYDDWRLPNVRELYSLIDLEFWTPALCNTEGTAKWTANNPFNVVAAWMASPYWTSTTSAVNANNAWYIELSRGWIYSSSAKTTAYYVWPVRGGRK